jgi:hypothetical protein
VTTTQCGGPEQRSDRYGLWADPAAKRQIPRQQNRDSERPESPAVELRTVRVTHGEIPVSRPNHDQQLPPPIAANGATMIGSRAAAAPRSSRGGVARARRQAITPNATTTATPSPASGQTSHIG